MRDLRLLIASLLCAVMSLQSVAGAAAIAPCAMELGGHDGAHAPAARAHAESAVAHDAQAGAHDSACCATGHCSSDCAAGSCAFTPATTAAAITFAVGDLARHDFAAVGSFAVAHDPGAAWRPPAHL